MGILMETTDVNLGSTGQRRLRAQPEYFGVMGTPGEAFFSEAVHTIAINTRETEFGSIVEPIPITFKTYKQLQANGQPLNGYGFAPQPTLPVALPSTLRKPDIERPSTSSVIQSPLKHKKALKDTQKVTRPPPKKKWIRDYYEEEPAVSVRAVSALPAVAPRVNGVVRGASPPAPAAALLPVEPPPAPALVPAPAVPAVPAVPAAPPAPQPTLLDFAQEHSRPRTSSNGHSNTQIPSPPSVSSTGSSNGSSSSGGIPRAGTREVHNKLEKNRRAHLKECFELLKRQLPATPDDKKTSNLSILGSAIRYIQVLRRKERECEHEMERLAREKIAAQQRLAALKRDVSIRATVRPRSDDPISEEKDREEIVNGQILGIPISITSTSPPRMEACSSPPRTLNLSTKLRTLPIQITPTTSQVVRTSYARHNTLTLTTLTPADNTNQNGVTPIENGMSNALGTLVHPAQIHLPISQMVGGGGLVVGGALQLVPGHLRVLTHTHNGITTSENNRIPKENGIVSPPPSTSEGVVVSQLPLVVSQPSHLLHTHTFTHKMVETQMVKTGVPPMTVSAQYLSAAIVKPVVVVSAPSPHPHS